MSTVRWTAEQFAACRAGRVARLADERRLGLVEVGNAGRGGDSGNVSSNDNRNVPSNVPLCARVSDAGRAGTRISADETPSPGAGLRNQPQLQRNLSDGLAPHQAAHWVRLELPWPPSGNHATRHTGAGHYSTARHRAYRAAVARAVAVTRASGGCDTSRDAPCGSVTETVSKRWRLALCAEFRPPDRRRRDLDNLAKVLLDALQHASVYEDDASIDLLVLRRGPPVVGGSVTVELWPDSGDARRGPWTIAPHSGED